MDRARFQENLLKVLEEFLWTFFSITNDTKDCFREGKKCLLAVYLT